MELLILLGIEALALGLLFWEVADRVRRTGRNRRTGSRLPAAFWQHLKTW